MLDDENIEDSEEETEKEPQEDERTNSEIDLDPDVNNDGDVHDVVHVSGMYQNWFLDYASYVILERAVPGIEDGLKPVQRRILHSFKDLDDGRYNKVANLIGHTMKYHPHGDASIGDAMVQLGQKELLLDTQGNWGNILTGDRAAAPRYIEARLSKFALDVVFNAKTTNWLSSYDGRSKEPQFLPIKFPLLLAQGVEGIAVGLACKIMPHNFIELIDASIKILRGKKVEIFPDFPTAGTIDISQYNAGLRGGKIRVRAKVNQLDKKTLVISELPFGSTTSSLIESIIKANQKGKIKIKKVEDNTADKVEILIHLPASTSPDKTIDALYAFTNCENSISPNSCVIEDGKPMFLEVNEILQKVAANTQYLLQLELKIRQKELEDQWHYLSLERIFIENKIYRDIEECETWEAVISAIDKGLKPYVKGLKRPVTEDDIVKLTEIKIKRISKFDADKVKKNIQRLEEDLKEVKDHLANIVDYAVDYFKDLKKKYGKGRGRKTEIKSFDTIVASKVAVANVKLYVSREEGFAGFGMKKDEFVCDCSDIDDVVVFRKDGTMKITKISPKAFIGKDIVHIGIWKKGDTRTIYNMIYQDGTRGNVLMKRFAVTGITRDKEYPLTKGKDGSKVLYFTANPNGESEVLIVNLRAKPKLKKTKFELNFGDVSIKGRAAGGNILTKHTVSKIIQKEKGVSTLGARKMWFDDSVQRLNVDERGDYLGEFSGNDKILTIMQSGELQLYSYSLSNHFDEDMIFIGKWNPNRPVTAIYYDGSKQHYFVKRFLIESTDKKMKFITDHADSFLEFAFTDSFPVIELAFAKSKTDTNKPNEVIKLSEFIAVKGVKALGNRLSAVKIKSINELEPLAEIEEEAEDKYQEDIVNKELIQDYKEDLESLKETDPVSDHEPNSKKSSSKSKNEESSDDDDDAQIKLDL